MDEEGRWLEVLGRNQGWYELMAVTYVVSACALTNAHLCEYQA